MTTREDVIAAVRNARAEIDDIMQKAPAAAWANGSYEGWTAHDLLAHIASTSGPASFILMMAKPGPPPGMAGGAFDQDAFNAQQVAIRAERPVDAIADEIRANLQRDVQAVEAADQALLDEHYVAQWGTEGTVAFVITASYSGHFGMHLADLRKALALT